MFRYTIQAFNNTDYGPMDEIKVKVVAPDEVTAKARAAEIAPRTSFTVIQIEDLPSDSSATRIKKG